MYLFTICFFLLKLFLLLRFKQRPKKGGKNARRRTNEGLTNNKQNAKMRKKRKEAQHLDSRPPYPHFEWAEVGSQEYWDAITDINESYRNMLSIRKTKVVFRVAKEGISTMLTAKTKDNFDKAKRDIKTQYNSNMNAKKATLNNFQLRTELIPNLGKYTASPDQRPPTNRETIVKEQIPTFEQYLLSLNTFKCSMCMNEKNQAKPLVDDPGD